MQKISPPAELQPAATSTFKALYSIEGMTCAACTGTITRRLSETEGFSNINVNLLTSSLNLLIHKSELIEQVTQDVEELGYECTLVYARPTGQPNGSVDAKSTQRTVEIKVENLMCSVCPQTVMTALRPLQEKALIQILKPLENPSDPILKISYTPSAPFFTIRNIFGIITSDTSHTHQSPFVASIHHPPTLEQLSYQIQLRERATLLWRLIINVIIAVPTFIIGIVFASLLPSSHHLRQFIDAPIWAGTTTRGVWALFFLATPVQFYCSWHFHQKAVTELIALWSKRSRTPLWQRFVRFGSMNLLISLGISVSYFSSIALLALSSVESKSDLKGNVGMGTTYFDSVVFLSMFLLSGSWLQAYTRCRTTDAIRSLARLRPQTALLLDQIGQDSTTSLDDEKNGGHSKAATVRQVPIDHLEIGDFVRVVAGGTPPTDGTIEYCESSAFDESMLTGESIPVHKTVGDQVFAGTICKSGFVDLEVEHIEGGTILDKIVEVIKEGQASRAAVERLADLLAAYFAPFVVFVSLTTWIIWIALGESGSLPEGYLDISTGGWVVWSLRFAIAVFVIACPCGVGLAAPTAFMVGSGLAAKYGVLARGGGEAFEEGAKMDIVCFDKTGTLTEGGDLRVDDVFFGETIALHDELLGMVKGVESASSHPLARALVRYCDDKGVAATESSHYKEVAGRGSSASFTGFDLIVGSETYMAENGVTLESMRRAHVDEWRAGGRSVVLTAMRPTGSKTSDSPFELVAGFAVSDSLRQEAAYTVKQLQEAGISTWMISGDNLITCKAIAQRAGIPETNIIAGVLPHEKAEHVKWLQRTGVRRFGRKSAANAKVAMCGDGINDAPAFAVADVSIALGSGSDLAVSSASFVLLSSSLRRVLTILDLSRTVMRRVKFNFAWAIVYNMIALPIAAGVVYPAHHARLDPVWASLAMALSSVSVLTSSLLLKLHRPPPGSL